MSTQKRPYGAINGQLRTPRPSKATKLTLATKDEEIENLRAQISELHAFIISQGLESKAPPLIREQLENSPIAAIKLDETIRAYIKEAFAKRADVYCYAWSAGGRADEMSQPMAWIIGEIRRLARKAEGLELAFNLMLYLSESICATVEDRGAHYGFWSSETPADELLLELAAHLRAKKAEFNPALQTAALAWQINRLRGLGIQTFFPRSYALMQSWAEGPDAAPTLYDQLKSEIYVAHAEIKNEIDNHNAKLTSDDYSLKMVQFIPHIRRLSSLSVAAVRLAFDLLMYLGQNSYGALENGGRGAPNRPSDPAADELLVELATRLKEQDPGFTPSDETAELKRRFKKLKKHAIRTYFPKAIELMWPWLPGAATEYHDDIKKRIIKGHKDTVTKLFSQKDYKDKRATSDWLSVKMADFLPELKRLSEIQGGLLPAFGLMVLAGNFSYLRDERLDPYYGWGPKPPEWWGGRRSDPVADDLMVDMVEQIQEEHPHFRPVTEITQLQEGAKFLSSHNIETFFSKALPLMASWIPETANPNANVGFAPPAVAVEHLGYPPFENGMMA